MSDDGAAVVYLEPDDEITTVVRRLRETQAPRVILVAAGRTKATSSAMGLRLLAGIAGEEGREIVLVADAAARSLAAEAGIPAAGSVADARELRVTDAAPPRPASATGARIVVARGSRPVPLADVVAAADTALDETRPVPVPKAAPGPGPVGPAARRRGRTPAALVMALALLLVGAVAAAAVLLPAATIRIDPRAEPIGPFAYELGGAGLELHTESGEEAVSATGTATGIREVRARATGTVVLQNWNTVAVEAPAGTEVAAGETVFTTDATVVVPPGELTGDGTIAPGTASVGVTAVAAGPAGNVAARAVDTMRSEPTASRLRGFPNSRLRVVVNPEPTSGGASEDVPVVEQADVDAVLAALREQLTAAVAAAKAGSEGRIYLDPAEGEERVDVTVPDDLVGREEATSFELEGTLRWTISWLDREEVEAAARTQLHDDPTAVPAGHELLDESVTVTVDPPARSGDEVRVTVHVAAASATRIDEAVVRELAAGLTPAEAEAALEVVGDASVELWPGWVERVPEMAWRVAVEIGSEALPRPSASGSPAP